MKKTALLTLALLAAPAVALAAPEMVVHQAATATLPCSIPRTLKVVRALPFRVTLTSMQGPPIRITIKTGITTATSMRPGEIVKLKIVPRGRP